METLITLAAAAVLFGGVLLSEYLYDRALSARAREAGVPVPMARMTELRCRKTNPARVVKPLIAAARAGVRLEVLDLELHHMSGGNVKRVVQALIAARDAGVDLDFERAADIDLAGHDVLEAVRSGRIPPLPAARG